jgi:hypothetical protein
MSGEQRLNSVDRFRKQPGRLVLEEHSHCEVPAGCGGVVLRWRNPQAALPLTIHLYAPVKAECFLDGTPLEAGRVDLVPGRHVAGILLKDVNQSAGLLMFAAVHGPKDYQRTLPSELTELPVKLLTACDGTWKFTLDPPASEAWKALDFDDGGWPVLAFAPTPRLAHQDFGAWQASRCTAAGALCLGLPSPVETNGAVWVRKVFEVPAPVYPRAPE